MASARTPACVIAATHDFAMLGASPTAPGAAMARLLSLLLLASAALPAQADEHTVVVKAAAPDKGCVEVEVNVKVKVVKELVKILMIIGQF